MSPRKRSRATPRVAAEVRRLAVTFGLRVREARIARGWSVSALAGAAAISPEMIYRAEAGAPTSTEMAVRLALALDRRVEIDLIDRRRRRAPSLSVDLVHSAMGETEASHLRELGFGVGLDEPYQHYQFAGRADVVAWDLEHRALLHLENRTRFPDFQEMAGAFNAKRAYLGSVLADRLQVRGWASETHVIVALWSSDVLHSIRLRAASFRALCPDPEASFEGWWSGVAPLPGRTSALVVLDPVARGRQAVFIGLERALLARPRHRGYAEARAALGRAA